MWSCYKLSLILKMKLGSESWSSSRALKVDAERRDRKE
jgi:hypothetical protein